MGSKSCKTCSSAGRRVPPKRGRIDRMPGTFGKRLMKHGIESASRDQRYPAWYWHAVPVPARGMLNRPSA
jgi:hypothetical protein